MSDEARSQIQIVDNVFVKMHFMEYCGQKIYGHEHTFDHITLLAVGSVLMKANGKEVRYNAPHLIVTPKGVKHEFECLTSKATLCCIHAIRDGDDIDDVAPQSITSEEANELMLKYSMLEPQK